MSAQLLTAALAPLTSPRPTSLAAPIVAPRAVAAPLPLTVIADADELRDDDLEHVVGGLARAWYGGESARA